MRPVPKWIRDPGRIPLQSVGLHGKNKAENTVWADRFFMTQNAQEQLRRRNMYVEIGILQENEKIIQERKKKQEENEMFMQLLANKGRIGDIIPEYKGILIAKRNSKNSNTSMSQFLEIPEKERHRMALQRQYFKGDPTKSYLQKSSSNAVSQTSLVPLNPHRCQSLSRRPDIREQLMLSNVEPSQEDKIDDVQTILSRTTPFSTENRQNKQRYYNDLIGLTGINRLESQNMTNRSKSVINMTPSVYGRISTQQRKVRETHNQIRRLGQIGKNERPPQNSTGSIVVLQKKSRCDDTFE